MGLILILSSFYVLADTIAYWKFDEGSGNNVFDETTNGNHGMIYGEAIWTTDSISGYALEFDGVDDKISIIKTSSVDLTDNVVLEAYVKRKSNTDGSIIAKNGPYYLAIRDNVIAGGVYANDGNCPTSCITSNTWTAVNGNTILEQEVWYKLKMEYNGTSINVYVNDILDGSVPKIGQMPQVSQQIFISWGEPGLNQFFNGIIDEVKILTINGITPEPEPDIEERLEELENRVDELEERINEQESLIQKIIDFIKKLPKGLSKKWVD